MNTFGISLKEQGITPNGVIHLGAGTGEFARYYHTEGVHKVMWVEQDNAKYQDLYQNTASFGMSQLYYIQKLGNYTKTDNSLCTFKSLWRRYSHEIDIETYDFLCVDIKHNADEVLQGMDDFIKLMPYIALREPTNMCDDYLIHQKKYNILLENPDWIIYRK